MLPHINRVSVIENRVLHFADVILPVFRTQRQKRAGGNGRWNETIRKTFHVQYMLLYKALWDYPWWIEINFSAIRPFLFVPTWKSKIPGKLKPRKNSLSNRTTDALRSHRLFPPNEEVSNRPITSPPPSCQRLLRFTRPRYLPGNAIFHVYRIPVAREPIHGPWRGTVFLAKE